MSLIIILAVAIGAGLSGIIIGWFLRFIIALGKRGSMELEIKEMMLSAREQAEKITSEAEKESQKLLREIRDDLREQEEKLERTEDRLINKESLLDRRQSDLDAESDELKVKEEELERKESIIKELESKKIIALEKIANLSSKEARDELLNTLSQEQNEDLTARIQKMEMASKEKIDRRAKDILATAVQRLSTSVSSDIFSATIALPSDDVKGKIIGKEGRNIKSFERLSGVELIIDDTPNTITISCFDPVRREIAKNALQTLIEDGRIQPSKIEQSISEAKESISKIIKEKGEQAAYECGVVNLDSRILIILGRLHFRTSYGQNVLQHSIEVAHLAGMLAEELGADVKIAKAGGLLHDIGKAIDHEVSGSHVEIGRRILQKFGADEKIVKAMQSHHEEYPFETTESIIVQVADHLSGGRPGARRDNIENYIKRLEDLEAIANNFPGIEKSYALSAGREIRVFVFPDKINDLEAQKLARNIAKQIEEEIKYPGEIKITVIRENKFTEYAR